MKFSEMKKTAKTSLKMKYGFSILASILWALVSMGSVIFGVFIGVILVSGAIKASRTAFYLDIANNEFEGTDNIYRGFSMFSRSLNVIWWIFFNFLIRLIIGAFIFIISATNALGNIMSIIGALLSLFMVIISIRYIITTYLSFHILIDKGNEHIKAKECIRLSRKMTKGKVFNIILFELSFILWRLGVLLSLGILNIYFSPYYNTSKANYYLQLKNKFAANQI